MKLNALITALVTALVMLALAGCDKKPSEQAPVSPPAISSSATLPPGHPPINSDDSAMASPATTDAELTQKATVVSVIDIPQFTYLEVKQDNQTRWLAAATIAAKKGDVIQFDHGEAVSNFNSKTLMRTFPSITFVNRVKIVKGK